MGDGIQTFGVMLPGGIVSGFVLRQLDPVPAMTRGELLQWARDRGFIPPSKPRYRSRLPGKGRHRRRRVVVGLVRGR